MDLTPSGRVCNNKGSKKAASETNFAARRLTGLDMVELFEQEKNTHVRATALGQTKGPRSQTSFCSTKSSHLK